MHGTEKVCNLSFDGLGGTRSQLDWSETAQREHVWLLEGPLQLAVPSQMLAPTFVNLGSVARGVEEGGDKFVLGGSSRGHAMPCHNDVVVEASRDALCLEG